MNIRSVQWLYCPIVLFSTLFSCSNLPSNVKDVLELAGDNGKELQAVIDYYQEPKDSLKLKAAYFLIGNMSNKFSYDTIAIGPHHKFVNILDSLNSIPSDKRTKMKWWYENTPAEEKLELEVWYLNSLHWHPKFKKAIWDSLNSKYGKFNHRSLPIVRDIDVISSGLLIENIDLAFKVWQEKPWAKHVNFEDFCEFILPYRIAHEPLNNWRSKSYKQYSWIDSLYNHHSVIEVATMLNDSLQWFKNDDLFTQYPDQSLSDMYKTKSGICTDQNNLANYVLRSQGVPIIQVLKNKGTSWSAILDLDQKLVEFDGAFEAPDKGMGYMQKHMLSESYKLSKVMAYSYAKAEYPFSDLPREDIPSFFQIMDIKDVTNISQTNNVDVEVKLNIDLQKEQDFVFLCEFKSDKLDAISWSQPKKGKARFRAIGTNKIYIPAFYKNENYIPAGNPFYINEDGTVNEFTPGFENEENVRLYRKFGMGFRETKYAKSMIGGEFQGSNDRHFRYATDLFTIINVPKYREEKVVNTKDEFRYIRYVSNPKSRVSELSFFNSKNERLSGKYITKSDALLKHKTHLAFDNDIRTNFSYDGLADGWWVGLDLGKPTQISKISYLFQNSFNTIEIGHLYELFYWSNGWKSLGIKEAKREYLDFKVPENTMFKLENLTEGKDQQVFFMSDGRQVWG